MRIQLYTDGAAKGNPGNGGYGVVLKSEKGHYKEASEGFRMTTNNRMELMAVIVGLELLKQEGQDVTVYSDSKYVVDAVEKKWLEGWVRKGFVKTKNVDLWQRFLKIYSKHRVRFVWVKGHAGHPENERCDELAVAAAMEKELKIDAPYEAGIATGMFEE
jgi:ribonuclease HI